MIILGIDPGLRNTGYGVISYQPHRLQFISAGLIKTNTKQAFSEKLRTLYDGISEVITLHKPDVFAIEETFYNTNAKTSLLLGHARGVLILAGAHAKLDVLEYAAKFVKKALTGNGSASKEQVKYMVERILKYDRLPENNFDISDALAVALTHQNQIKFKQLINN